jgi:hypothetical protein
MLIFCAGGKSDIVYGSDTTFVKILTHDDTNILTGKAPDHLYWTTKAQMFTFHPIISISQPNKFTWHPILSRSHPNIYMHQLVEDVHFKWKT